MQPKRRRVGPEPTPALTSCNCALGGRAPVPAARAQWPFPIHQLETSYELPLKVSRRRSAYVLFGSTFLPNYTLFHQLQQLPGNIKITLDLMQVLHVIVEGYDGLFWLRKCQVSREAFDF
ncbi:hypothetical protein EVAR_18907_1 [Eumeta japonica]|uniref:Uncharacterized protein n=1 Tax=Eumeta variegata TaxID=151549 RepID=A0A4C1V3Y0_EUMVA|nr:hypothetical protein EVAR_18907_1 [Eumeta japonica]